MAAGDSMGPYLQLVGVRFSNFLLRKPSREFKLRAMSIFDEIQMATFRYCVRLQSHVQANCARCCDFYLILHMFSQCGEFRFTNG